MHFCRLYLDTVTVEVCVRGLHRYLCKTNGNLVRVKVEEKRTEKITISLSTASVSSV